MTTTGDNVGSARPPTPPISVRDAVRDEAVEWFIAFCEHEMSPQTCQAFDTWLKASPENVRAYLQVSAFWESAGGLNERRRLEVDELVRRAAAEVNVIALDPRASAITAVAAAHAASTARAAQNTALTTRSNRYRRATLAAAALLLVFLGGALALWQSLRDPVYATQVGESRTVTLSDGSVVELNARSRLRIEYRQAYRRVALLDGQALFRVAKNATRPFIVVSGTTRVRAVGTEFDVYRKVSDTVVTVVEGQVAITNSAASDALETTDVGRAPATASTLDPHRSLLRAGEQLRASPHALGTPTHANPALATAWTQGKLIFDSTPLSEVLDEVNRYNPKPLSIDDPNILVMHVSGTFATSDEARIVEFLSQRFGLVVRESAQSIHLAAK